jgi:hypothetical protein
LLKEGADVHAKDFGAYTALFEATWKWTLHYCSFAAGKKKGANVNAKGEYGNTPLHCACASGHDRLVLLFLKRGANPSIKNNDDKTPLDVLFAQTENYQGCVAAMKLFTRTDSSEKFETKAAQNTKESNDRET